MLKQPTPLLFGQELEQWLHSSQPKTIDSLNEVADEKTFAVLFLLLMSVSALPVPTGGITHIFEAIVMLLSIELIIGRHTIWLPQRLRERKLPQGFLKKTLPTLIRFINRIERYARPRFVAFMSNRYFFRLAGFFVLSFAIGSFLAPPFSGLDTLPSLGVVLISLSLIFEDALLFILACAVGLVGIGLEIALAGATVNLFQRII